MAFMVSRLASPLLFFRDIGCRWAGLGDHRMRKKLATKIGSTCLRLLRSVDPRILHCWDKLPGRMNLRSELVSRILPPSFFVGVAVSIRRSGDR